MQKGRCENEKAGRCVAALTAAALTMALLTGVALTEPALTVAALTMAPLTGVAQDAFRQVSIDLAMRL